MAGFVRKILSHLGLFKEDGDKLRTVKTSKGFSVTVAVPTEKMGNAPVVSQCTPGAGGVQGLRWYAEKLRMDEDGDVAQEFLNEVIPETPGPDNSSKLPSFEVKMQTRPVKLKGPICTFDGNVHQSVESSSGLRWG